jgi:excisionase family DNA binding protein
MAPSTRVIGIEEAAAHLGESVSTIRRRIKRGEHVPGLMPKSGRKYRFSLPVIESYVSGGYAKRQQARS